MRILADGVNANRHASDYIINYQTVTKNDTINIKMEKGGGWIAILTPEKN